MNPELQGSKVVAASGRLFGVSDETIETRECNDPVGAPGPCIDGFRRSVEFMRL
jgi:hypothetical protein